MAPFALAFVIGSISPLEQSTVMLPTMSNRRRLARITSIISHNCFVLLARRDTSKVIMGLLPKRYNWHFKTMSPCSYSKNTTSAPALGFSLYKKDRIRETRIRSLLLNYHSLCFLLSEIQSISPRALAKPTSFMGGISLGGSGFALGSKE